MSTIIGTIGAIMRYPVKSLLGEKLDQCTINPSGLEGDRTYALIEMATGKIASAKQPNLWRDLLTFAAVTASSADPPSIVITDAAGNQLHPSDPDFDAMLSERLGRKVKLVSTRPAGLELNRARPDEVMAQGLDAHVTQDVLEIGAAAPTGGFFDFAPLHLMTSASLDAIGAAAPEAPIAVERYRPNIVIENPAALAFGENRWVGRRIHIGPHVRLEVIAPTPRCAVPMLAHGSLPYSRDAVAAVQKRNQVEFPLLGPGTFPCLGVYATVVTTGVVQRGDQVVME